LTLEDQLKKTIAELEKQKYTAYNKYAKLQDENTRLREVIESLQESLNRQSLIGHNSRAE